MRPSCMNDLFKPASQLNTITKVLLLKLSHPLREISHELLCYLCHCAFCRI